MIVIFSRWATVIERAFQEAMSLLAPEIDLHIVTWSEDGDHRSLQRCLKKYRPLVLVVSTHDCSAGQLSQLFQSGMQPAPISLVVFGPGAEDVVRERKVLDWVNGKAMGQHVLNLTSLMMLLQKTKRGPVMKIHLMSGCHDLKSALRRIIEDNGKPLSERLRIMLARLEVFTTDHIDFDGDDDDVVTSFFRAFRAFLSTAVTKGIPSMGGESKVLERCMAYINALSSVADMGKLLDRPRKARSISSPQMAQSVEADADNRIPVSVLIVEDNHDFAKRLIEKYELQLSQVERFKIEFVSHTPKRDSDGKVIETRREFRERLKRRVSCQSTLSNDESLTRLQAVVMDYAMDNFAFDDHTEGSASLSGIDLSRDIRRLRPGVDIFLLTGKNIFQVVKEGNGLFERVFWKHDPTSGEINELFYSLNKCLERKYHAPFWEALYKFTRRPVIVMHAMSLARGKSAKKSTVLKDFVDFYSDNYFMAETSATIEPLDSLLYPVGSILQAQQSSARAFGAKKTYFVTNGTSTANKIVLQAILAPGDAILVDRNCHISHHYGISLARARPYYLEPYHLESYGISGGIPLSVLAETLKNFLDVENEGVTDKAALRLPRAILLTNCTFDGIICQPRKVIATVLGVLRERGIAEDRLREIVFLFDEAWFAYARFHPRFVEHTGMATAHTLCEEERVSGSSDNFYNKNLRVYATQSTHKTLSAFRQASMIHVWDPMLETNGTASLRLDEAYLTHTSTSPHSGIIASLDVARRQAELEGCALVEDALLISDAFRNDFKRSQEPNATANWSHVGKYFGVLTEAELIPEEYRDQFLLDPSKITLHIKKGCSGSDLKKLLLTEHDIQFNKHSDNTVLLMVNAGGSMSSMGTLKNVLTRLTEQFERKELLGGEVAESPAALKLPSFSYFWDVDVKGYNPGRHRDIAFFFNNEAKWGIEWLPVGELLVGRAAATFIVPYPPGYPMLVPGQIIDGSTSDFLTMLGTKEIHGTRSGKDGRREVPVFVPHIALIVRSEERDKEEASVTGQGLVEFTGNDASYLKWMEEHSGGFVVNTGRKRSPRYMVLHKATCGLIKSRKGVPDGGFTERGYIKICSMNLDTLREWVRGHGRPDGSFSSTCGTCKPAGGR